MKKLIMFATAFMFAVTLALAGTSNAGWFGFGDKDKSKSKSDSTATEQILPAGEKLTLSGTISENNRFVDDNGLVYNLANNDKSEEVKALSGQRVEIKGTVMEQAGKKTVEVNDYKIIH